MSAVHEIDDIGRAQPVTGLHAMRAGRHPLVARCLGDVEPLLLEKRNHAIAIKIRGRWYAVDASGTFRARIRQSDAQMIEINGSVRLAGGQLTVDAVESVLTTGECKRWHASAEVESATAQARADNRHIVLLGTAYYSFLDGPTETPLRAEINLVRRGDGRAIVLPPALTTNRGELEIPIEGNGSFAYRAQDGTIFKVNGNLESHSLELVIETAGSIGWTRKELAAAF
jgi:hypothetical protein